MSEFSNAVARLSERILELTPGYRKSIAVAALLLTANAMIEAISAEAAPAHPPQEIRDLQSAIRLIVARLAAQEASRN